MKDEMAKNLYTLIGNSVLGGAMKKALGNTEGKYIV